MDLFHLDSTNYLLVADYYSKFPLMQQLDIGNYTSTAVVRELKKIFSEHGIPERVISDNGLHYSSYTFKEFASSWDFQHETSLPGYLPSRNVDNVTIIFHQTS